MELGKKQQTAQLSGLFTEDGLREMTKSRISYAADMRLPYDAPGIDGCLGFMERCELTRMNLFYTEVANSLLSDHSREAWTARKLASLRSEISKLKNAVERATGPHY